MKPIYIQDVASCYNFVLQLFLRTLKVKVGAGKGSDRWSKCAPVRQKVGLGCRIKGALPVRLDIRSRTPSRAHLWRSSGHGNSRAETASKSPLTLGVPSRPPSGPISSLVGAQNLQGSLSFRLSSRPARSRVYGIDASVHDSSSIVSLKSSGKIRSEACTVSSVIGDMLDG
jgi:hypothetical protein